MLPYLVILSIGLLASSILTFFTFVPFALSLKLGIKNQRENNSKSKNSLPKVSVLIAARNEEKVIGRCLKSILKQKYPKDKLEVIVVEDGSIDKTYEIAKKFEKSKRIKVFHRKNSSGWKSGALNYGLKFVKGDLIAFFDADHILKKNCIREVVNGFNDETIGGVTVSSYPSNYKENISTQVLSIQETLEGFSENVWKSAGASNRFLNGSYIIQKDIIDKINGFDENFITDEGYLTIKILQLGYKIKVIDKVLYLAEVPNSIISFFLQKKRNALSCLQFLKEISCKGINIFFRETKTFFVRSIHFFASFLPILITALLALWITFTFIYPTILISFITIIGIISAIGYVIKAQFYYFKQGNVLRNILLIPLWLIIGLLQLLYIISSSIVELATNRKFSFYRTPRSGKIVK